RVVPVRAPVHYPVFHVPHVPARCPIPVGIRHPGQRPYLVVRRRTRRRQHPLPRRPRLPNHVPPSIIGKRVPPLPAHFLRARQPVQTVVTVIHRLVEYPVHRLRNPPVVRPR